MTEAHPVKQPLTLDDVSARIKQICDNHVTNCARAKGELDRGVEALAADVEAASHLDQNAVAMIVFGQLKVMMTELQEVAG